MRNVAVLTNGLAKAVSHPANHGTLGDSDIIYPDADKNECAADVVTNLHPLNQVEQLGRHDRAMADHSRQSHDQTGGQRFLTTIMMTDAVNSTEMAARVGDESWRDVMNKHNAAAIRTVTQNGGTLIKFLGDGFLATFQSPSSAIACAQQFQSEARAFALSVRAGIHSGECLRIANDVTGIALAITARVLNQAPGERVWVSSTVRDLVVGSELEFVKVGSRKLRGLPDEWTLYEVDG